MVPSYWSGRRYQNRRCTKTLSIADIPHVCDASIMPWGKHKHFWKKKARRG